MKRAAAVDRLELGLAFLTLIFLFLRLGTSLYFDQAFLFMGASLYLYYAMRMVFSFRHWGESKAGSLLNLFFFFAASFLLIGFLSRLLNWPGGTSILYLGLAFSLASTAGGLLFRRSQQSEWSTPWLRTHFYRQAILFSMTAIVLLVPRGTLFRLFLPEAYNQPQPTTLYYRNGAIKAQGTLLNGERSGEWMFFSAEGDTLEVVGYE